MRTPHGTFNNAHSHRTFWLGLVLVLLVVFLLISPRALATDVYVADTIQDKKMQPWGTATTNSIKDSIKSSELHRLVPAKTAEYILQPKLLKLGDKGGSGYILTIEKRRGDEIVMANQIRLSSLDELNKASAKATREILEGNPDISSATTMEP